MNAKRKKSFVVITIVAAIAAGLLAVVSFHSDDSHNLNFKYRAWKMGLRDFDPDYMRFLTVDWEFRQHLIGKPLSEVEKLFPNLHGPDKANDNQFYYSEYINHADYRWIGDSAWTIELEKGRVKEFHIWKG